MNDINNGHGFTELTSAGKLDVTTRLSSAISLSISHFDYSNPVNIKIPEKILMIRKDVLDPARDLLFIDNIPVARESWTYQESNHQLSWKTTTSSGHLNFYWGGLIAVGNIESNSSICSIRGTASAKFTCDVAENCGAEFKTDGSTIEGLTWDSTSPTWTNAHWQSERLVISYVAQNSPFGPPTLQFTFKDKNTGQSWSPMSEGTIQLQNNTWILSYTNQSVVPPDTGGGSLIPDSVFPYHFAAQEDSAALLMSGAMSIDNIGLQGTVIGFKGMQDSAFCSGYYQIGSNQAFSIFSEKLIIDGQDVVDSSLEGRTLRWSGLSSEQVKATGLPVHGTLDFSEFGDSALCGMLSARRLDATESLALPALKQANPPLLTQVANNSTELSIIDLIAMSPFQQNTNGNYVDIIQQKVTSDLNTIMQSFIPPTMWDMVYPGVPAPTLSTEQSTVANSPVAGVADPGAWYTQMATAVLTKGLQNGSDQNCKRLNGPRASTWLRSEIANSAVYQAHATLLFQYHWNNQFTKTQSFLQDQITNATEYDVTINAFVSNSITEIQALDTDEATKKKMETEIKAVGDYAKSNQLYWAFIFYKYNTSTAEFENLRMLCSQPGNNAQLAFLFQTNISVMTALDPSGVIAKHYNKELNDFLAINVLSSCYGFTGGGSDMALIKEYLTNLVNNNLASEDSKIKAAAQDLQNIMNDKEFEAILLSSLNVMRASSEAANEFLALPYVTENLVNWVKTNYPRFSKTANVFGGVLIAGTVSLAMFNLITACKDWKSLTTSEKAETVTNAVQLGTQVLSIIVRRGVQAYVVFTADGFSTAQRGAALAKLFSTGESDILNQGLRRVSSNMARWLGDVSGERNEEMLMMNIGENDEVAWTARIFGRNLDECLSARIGPLFIIAGMALSIAFIAEGETGVALASDAVSLAAGALTLFAMVGGWAVEAGIASAEVASVISAAGPLAVLAAFVGIGLLIYELCDTPHPTDPVKEFIEQYAQEAGLVVASQCSAIDYVTLYKNSTNNLTMVGFSLLTGSNAVLTDNTGNLSIGTPTNLPNGVWNCITNGVGLTRIFTVVDVPGQGLATYLLSLMSDNSIQFQPNIQTSNNNGTLDSQPTVVTQIWISIPSGNATLNNNNLYSLNITLQAVPPDVHGKYSPANATRWMTVNNNAIVSNSSTSTVFTLQMNGISPNYMKMNNLEFAANSIPDTSGKAPVCGVNPSNPLAYTVVGKNSAPFPDFLTLSTTTGKITPKGTTTPASLPATTFTITATSSILSASASADFTITVS